MLTAVQPTQVAMTDWTGIIYETDENLMLLSVPLSIAKNTMITYLSLHLIANKTLVLVYENAPQCTILK